MTADENTIIASNPFTAETRKACYDHVRSIVGGHESAKLADFSDREYEKYFLYDIVHFGWTGWIDVEQSIYEFAQEVR